LNDCLLLNRPHCYKLLLVLVDAINTNSGRTT